MPRHIGLRRILRLIDELQVTPTPLEDLAREHGVTTRTIRRDLETIHAVGPYRVRHEASGFSVEARD